jgi:hypothetical protein
VPTVTITPRYVNPPRDGKKYGSIKTDDGERYAVPAALTACFEPGVPTEAFVAIETWGGESVQLVRSVPGAVPENGSDHISTGAAPARSPPGPWRRHQMATGMPSASSSAPR